MPLYILLYLYFTLFVVILFLFSFSYSLDFFSYDPYTKFIYASLFIIIIIILKRLLLLFTVKTLSCMNSITNMRISLILFIFK